MKSQHRHELQTNELGKLLGRVTPVVEKFGTTRNLFILCGIIVAVLAIIWRVLGSHSESELMWTQFMRCQNAKDFGNLADTFRDTNAGAWARLNEGELLLQSGIELCFTDKKGGLSDLKQAQKAFNELLNAKSISVEVLERALIGKARLLETTSDENTQPAITAYTNFIKDFPNSVLTKIAQQRIHALSQERAQKFYAWFNRQNPKPEDRKKPRDSTSTGDVHAIDSDSLALPENPEKLSPSQPLDTLEPSKSSSTDDGNEPLLKLPASEQPARPSKEVPSNKKPSFKTPPGDADSSAAPRNRFPQSGAA